MTPRTLAARGLRYYWRTHLAVAAGVAIAVSALGGALVVGESVRASLLDLALARLGRTDAIVTASTFFTEPLAERVSSARDIQAAWSGAVPVFTLEGIVVHPSSGRRAGGVQVFGVDDRFWRFHDVAGVAGPAGRDAFVSTALARELGLTPGDPLLIRIQTPSAIPAGVIQGRRDQPGRAVRVNATRVLSSAEMGDFSPRAQQGEARTVFVPLDRLQRDVDLPHRVNMMLIGCGGEAVVRPSEEREDGCRTAAAERELQQGVERRADLADLGVRVRPLRDASYSIESETGYLSDGLARGVADAAREIGVEPVPVLTYLATAIKANGRETPYSLISALPQSAIQTGIPPASLAPPASPAPIWLSQWTADDLAAKAGDAVTVEYYLWSDADGLTTSAANFVVAGVLPMTGLAIDEDLTPPYPGVSTSADMAGWDPPFPVDLKRVRKKDEEFWDEYRTAPKAFVRIDDGQRLWQSTYGKITSIRFPAGTMAMGDLHAAIDKALPRHVPASLAGFRVMPVKSDAASASAGTTDFGEYFTYFSFFVVVASLMLTVLFFRLGVEQRAAEIGMLGALGYAPRTVAGILLTEGAAVAGAGALIGAAGATGYSALMMLGLRTWWVDAVGTTALRIHVSPAALGSGIAGGLVAALVCIVWSLRVLRRSSARQLMSGDWLNAASPAAGPLGRVRVAAVASLVIALALVATAAAELVPPAAGFFGSGTFLLIAGLCALTLWLRATSTAAFALRSWPLLRFGVRNARYRPSRSVLSAALIASAAFLIVSVGAFRKGADDVSAAHSGSGGYPLIGETLVPLMHDLNTPAGREALNLDTDLERLRAARFRLRPGDDASCLNLYQPKNPRLLGATGNFIADGRFTFAASMAESEDERRNPWLLLNRTFDDGAVPVIGDATSLAYALHLKIGEDLVMSGPGGQPLRLRIVAALRDSVLQSELIMHEAVFVRLFPRNEGYRVFLLSATGGQTASALEDQLQDFGMDVQSTAERLAAYHRVENTYLSTFQALGGLGLILGTLGLGTVLLRNVLERRRELALLRATGYRRSDLIVTVLAESAFLLASGLTIGVLCAVVATAPAFADRAQQIPIAGTLALLVAVTISGLLSTLLATRAVSSSELLPALRNE